MSSCFKYQKVKVLWTFQLFVFRASKTPSDFEMVKKGVRSNDARIDDSRQSVNLGNRFDGLRSWQLFNNIEKNAFHDKLVWLW